MQNGARCGAHAARQVALNHHRPGTQIGPARQHAIDDHARRAHPGLPSNAKPLLHLVQPGELRLACHQLAKHGGGSNVSEIAGYNRAPERDAL